MPRASRLLPLICLLVSLCAPALAAQRGFFAMDTYMAISAEGENAEEALALAELLAGMFNLAPRHGQKSEFAGPYFECMKAPFHGKNGHSAMQTPDLESAVAELKEKGFSFREETAAYDDAGKLKNIYLAGEYGGFAIHILRG